MRRGLEGMSGKDRRKKRERVTEIKTARKTGETGRGRDREKRNRCGRSETEARRE